MKKFFVLLLAVVVLAACEYDTTIKEVHQVPTKLAEQLDASQAVQFMNLDHRSYIVITTDKHVLGKVQVKNGRLVVDITESGSKDTAQQHIFRVESAQDYDTIIVKVNGEAIPAEVIA